MITFFFPVRLGLLCVFYLLAGSALALAAPDPAKLTRATPFLLAVWAIALFGQDRRVYDMIEMALLPLAVMGVGMASRYVLRVPEAVGDISYGTYIYHFAVAELVFTLTPERYRGGAAIAAAIAISAFIGWLSFQYVEKRALAKKAYRSQMAISDVSVAARAAMDSAPSLSMPE
jgi:peptidoglycan/LPS O-acetylase OafA/YrhL